MKKFILMCVFAVVGTCLSAQCSKGANAGKSCCAKKSTASTCMVGGAISDQAVIKQADAVAANDPTIVREVAADGKVSYFRTVADATGATSKAPVEFCTKESKFMSKEKAAGCCAKKNGAAACSRDAAKAKVQ